jgi:transcriptional regulator with XRE-family HTH domain
VDNIRTVEPKLTTRTEIGDRLRSRREYLGLTQQDVAARLGVSRVAYTQYETGRNEMAVTDLPRLGVILKVAPAYFLGDEDIVDVAESDVLRYYNGLPPTLKNVARQQLKALFDAQDAEAK